MSKRFPLVSIIAGALLLSVGCSGGGSPTAPAVGEPDAQSCPSHHSLWGMWRFAADPDKQALEIIPIRISSLHLNALTFLEPPPLVHLTLEGLEFNGDIMLADIGLRHPFLGLTEFTGFDVCGVFITTGSPGGFSDPGLIAPEDDDPHLLNADGYTRWWNPDEFPPDGTMFSYRDGLLGTPDAIGEFNATLNGYKLYTDELDMDDDILTIDPASRCMFSAGMKNIRRFKIEFPGGMLIFNYAVDACWEFPSGSYPWTAPDDFGPNANRPEAWAISASFPENTLWYEITTGDSGGDLSVLIDVYDHFNAEQNIVRIESPGNFVPASSATPIGGGNGFSTYQVDIVDATPQGPGEIEMLIAAECEASGYGGHLPGQPLTAYWFESAEVGDKPEECVVALEQKWVFDGLDDRIQSCPTLADIDGDGSLEIFVGDNYRDFYCLEHDGSVRWHVYLDSPVSFWYGSPAVEDFNGDNILDVVVSNLDPSTPTPNRMYILDGDDGSVIHSILAGDNWQTYPALADIGGPGGSPDGTLDIILNTDDASHQDIVVLDGTDFSELWRYDKKGYSISTPVTAEFDGDGIPDIVAISQTSGGTADNGVLLLTGDQNATPANRLVWMNPNYKRIHDTPALHDWTGDDIPDIAVANNPTTGTRYLYVLDGSDGSVVWQTPVMAGISSPALGDLNADGIPDIVVGQVWDDIFAFDGDPNATQRVLWNYHYDGSMGGNMDVRSQPMLCDADCDDVPDVFVGVGFSIPGPYNPGKFLILNGIDGTLIAEIDFPDDGEEVIFGGPAVGDVDNDGKIDFVFGTFLDKLYCYTTNTTMPDVPSAEAPWTQYACNIHNTGLYGDWF